jgi:hypothetical protein
MFLEPYDARVISEKRGRPRLGVCGIARRCTRAGTYEPMWLTE